MHPGAPPSGNEPATSAPTDGSEPASVPSSGSETAASAPVSGSEPAGSAPASGSEPAASAPVSGSEPAAAAPSSGSEPAGRASSSGSEPAASAPSSGSKPAASGSGKAQASVPPRSDRTTKARRCPNCRQTFSTGDARFCPFDGVNLVEAPDWSPSADPLLGTTVGGRYEVVSLVGEGGMGTVYEVRHTTLGRSFAMKVLRRDIAKDPDLVTRFTQEAKAAAAIGHPNIVTVSDFGSLEVGPHEPARPYFVMEFLEGMSFGSLLRAEKSVPPARVAPFFVQCARALEAAHQAGVIHRDLKPDNIFVVRKNDEEFVKLLDFGVAKIVGNRRLTRVGMVFGTPHYMSPEQAEGKHVDARTDIYALGVIMYECFSGRVPFEADTYMGVLTKHMFAVPEPLERVVPDATALGAFGPIVMRCLAKRPEDRYASMADLGAALDLALSNPPKAAEASMMDERPRKDALRLRDRDQMHGRVEVPAEVRAPLSRSARIGIGVAAIALPIAAALGIRAWQTSEGEAVAPAAGEATAEVARPAAAPTQASVATPAPAPSPKVETATPTTTAAPTGTSSVAEMQTAAGDPRVPAVQPASTSPGALPTVRSGSGSSKAPAHTGGGDIVDPWSNKKKKK